jgi:signal transduction histidine kinase
MSPLELLQLIGYATGAVLTLWMGVLLRRWRRGLGNLERVLFALAIAIGLWHASNLIITIHTLLGFELNQLTFIRRAADTIAVISIVFSYSLLLHAHLHLWAFARERALSRLERVRVFLSYIPPLFLIVSIPRLWSGPYRPMLVKLAEIQLFTEPSINYVQAFLAWTVYVLVLIAATDLGIAWVTKAKQEKRFMQTLAVSFLAIGAILFTMLITNSNGETRLGVYLQTFANLGSLLPTALLAYSIYRRRYLELVIKESLVVATFASAILIFYLYGIRTVGEILTARLGLREGVIESFLILGLVLFSAPLRRWIEKRFYKIFEREAALYREVVARISSDSGKHKCLPDLLRFVEEKTVQSLGLRRALLLVTDGETQNGFEKNFVRNILEQSSAQEWTPIEDEESLRRHKFDLAFPLRRENRVVGLMLVDAPREALTRDVRAVLEILAGQVAIAIEECRLVEENVQLERKLAQGERLAALGQMAATVAHEIKNPLSAIKSIAQVMREDENVKREYERDLSLIIGETDRLNRSVAQLLSFARRAPEMSAESGVDEIVNSVLALYASEAASKNITLTGEIQASDYRLTGPQAAALRDALSNLVLNALQAAPFDGKVFVESSLNNSTLMLAVEDNGAGVSENLRDKIWEPFFTTKQRGTGLGLAIVRKRVEEIGGKTFFLESKRLKGSRFELHIPTAR